MQPPSSVPKDVLSFKTSRHSYVDFFTPEHVAKLKKKLFFCFLFSYTVCLIGFCLVWFFAKSNRIFALTHRSVYMDTSTLKTEADFPAQHYPPDRKYGVTARKVRAEYSGTRL